MKYIITVMLVSFILTTGNSFAAVDVIDEGVVDEGIWKEALSVSFAVNQAKSVYADEYGSLLVKESINLGVYLNGELTRDTDKNNWKNVLKLEYSRSRVYDEGYAGSSKDWLEDLDQLLLDSVFRWKLGKHINPYIACNFDTSIIDVGHFNEWEAFKPVQVRESGGISVPVISNDKQELIGRIGFFVQNYINKTEYDENFNGIEGVIDYEFNIRDDSALTSKLELFSSEYEIIEYDDSITEKQYIELKWDNTLVTPITRFISVNVSFNIFNTDITDKEIDYEWEQKLYLSIYYDIF